MKDFERIIPEQAGVSSKAILRLLDELESGLTEPHGILIMRHGKICAEGAWKPYAPGINHGMQSFTKTYAATAIGIACRLGLVSLDEKLTDIFPGKGEKQPFSDRLTVRNLLRMGTGMESLPGFDGDWVDNFLRHPITRQPGSAFFYNSVGSTMLGAIIRQKTGKTLHAFLSEHLFPKIGIDPEHLGWMRLPDGMEIGGSGLFATLEDNLRLMKLYLDGGVCDGERILSEEYVQLATTCQIDNGPGPSPEASSGYGFQMWMCSRPGCFRADGAMGQYGFVAPKEDMVIILHQTMDGPQADTVLSYFYHLLDSGVDCDLGTEADARALQKRLACLSLPAPRFSPHGNKKDFTGEWVVTDGRMHIGLVTGGIMQRYFPVDLIDSFSLAFEGDECILTVREGNRIQRLSAGMDGAARRNRAVFPRNPVSMLEMACSFEKDNVLLFECRMPETCYAYQLRMTLNQDGTGMSVQKIYTNCDPEPDAGHQATAVKK